MTYKAPSKPHSKGNRRISLFNLVKKTQAGRRVICRDLTFTQAAGLVAEIPAAIIKFNRMGAVQ